MTIEESIATLTTATTNLITAVGAQQTSVNNALSAFNSVISRVNNELNSVNNTSDMSKPISNAARIVLDSKQPLLVSGENISTVNGMSLLGGNPLVIERSATSLNFKTYEHRGLLRTLTPQVDDSTLVEGLGLFMWVDSKEEPDDDETCFTTSTGQWLLRLPSLDLIDAWNLHDTAINDDWQEDEITRFNQYLNK